MQPGDAEQIAALCGQLGYPSTSDDIRMRAAQLTSLQTVQVAVEAQSQQVIGWVEAIITHHLHSDTAVEISGLVIAETHRSQGIGRELVRRIEEWAQRNALSLLRVRSNATRTRTHRFYQELGFTHVKTSLVFEKNYKRERTEPRPGPLANR